MKYSKALHLSKPKKLGDFALFSFAGVVAFTLMAPLIVIIPMSFSAADSFSFPPRGLSLRWYENFFLDPNWYRSAGQSVGIALVVTILSLIIGTMAALALSRMKGFLHVTVSGLLLSPMIIPVVVSGVGIYAVFLKWHLTGNYLGFVLAHTAIGVPFVLTTVSAALRTFDRTLEYAAANCGATSLETFFLVTLPIIRPTLASGALFAFSASFDEVVVAQFLTSPDLKTLPVKMFTSVYVDSDPTLAAVSSLIIALTTIAILVVMRSNRAVAARASA